MPGRVLAILCAVVLGGVLTIVSLPQLFGLQHAPGFAQIVAFRGPLALTGIGFALIAALVLAFARRRFAPAVFLVVMVLFAGVNAGILASRGFGAATAVAAGDRITVLSWNTMGGAADAETIARLALDRKAQVIALPETTDATATRVAEIMGTNGTPMWSHTVAWSASLGARSTSVLIAADLGDYRLNSDDGSTSVLPSIVARPVNGDGPIIAAVHPVSPIRGEMASWRSDLSWITRLCDTPNLIVAGDFNATLDHLDLGACTDAAQSSGTAGLGTWPTGIPAFLSAPIDHVVTSPQWHAVTTEVVQSEDAAGSDHRPIVATLARN